MRTWNKAVLSAILLVISLVTLAPAAHAEVVAADLTIQRARLTEQRVLRIKATYVCPEGFHVKPSLPARAFARQQTDIYPSSQDKKFSGIVCDGTRRDVLVRFVKPRHPQGAQWEFGALTQVNLGFQANTDDPYFFVYASDAQTVIV